MNRQRNEPILSKWCQPGQPPSMHGWCANRSYDECNCECACHKPRRWWEFWK